MCDDCNLCRRGMESFKLWMFIFHLCYLGSKDRTNSVCHFTLTLERSTRSVITRHWLLQEEYRMCVASGGHWFSARQLCAVEVQLFFCLLKLKSMNCLNQTTPSRNKPNCFPHQTVGVSSRFWQTDWFGLLGKKTIEANQFHPFFKAPQFAPSVLH